MLRADYHHQRASSGAFLGGNGRGNAASLRVPRLRSKVCASIVKLTVSFHLNAHCTPDETDGEQPPNANPNRGQFASHPSLPV
jgi:hypothetical protein